MSEPEHHPAPTSGSGAWLHDPALRPWHAAALAPAPASPPPQSTSPTPTSSSTASIPSGRSRRDLGYAVLDAPGVLLCSTSKPDLLDLPRAARVNTTSTPASAQPQPATPPATAADRITRPRPPATPVGTAFAVNDLLTRRRARPTSGWRRVVYSATAGRCNPGLSVADADRRRLITQVRTHLAGSHQVVAASLKGGIGKTTITACLGLTLAEHRGDRIVALDANPDAGSLADRLTGHVGITIRDLITNLDTIRSWTDIAHYTSLAGRLQVLASDQDPAMSEAFTRDEYHAVTTLLRRYFSVLLTDSGTGLVHSAMGGALEGADTLVIAGAATLDAASRASKTLDWLEAHGYNHLVERAVVALSHDRTSRYVDTSTIREHFTTRCHAVVDLPPDPHLAIGGPIDLNELQPRTRDAYLTLAAHVAEQFAWQPAAPPTQIPHGTTTTSTQKGQP